MSSLLDVIEHLITRLYARSLARVRPDRFLLGSRGYRSVYGGDARDGPRLLVRSRTKDLRVAIYYPDELIEVLEQNNPLRSLDDSNVDAFDGFVEEIDHFLLLAARHRSGRTVSRLELELHANLSKYFLGRFLIKRREGFLSARRKLWLLHHLFQKKRFSEPGQASRYREARRLAIRYIQSLLALPPRRRLDDLRCWSVASLAGKVRRIEAAGVCR